MNFDLPPSLGGSWRCHNVRSAPIAEIDYWLPRLLWKQIEIGAIVMAVAGCLNNPGLCQTIVSLYLGYHCLHALEWNNDGAAILTGNGAQWSSGKGIMAFEGSHA
ncbi:MAG: hypothetical protein ACREDM_07820 [Methylocella sp.]